ncbi:glycosyltransferase family 2 protein [Rhodococcus sp. D2-41]|uniref:Glycosyltransferase n=1 Tax=Speluncibacter jeojiensis TaxID=2710754 RepID=A0A9X4RFQ8_9ACTN|nr:glycosyltransferase family 2 protein [Rhodococcus sp. D2-41]MDG3009334.1 glycosyltransferase family 2 protein [Rhodococcus sp. D2-41]MDG3016879.1 glycosyltransferase [Corynebacteriales bacterium D3-21]
MVIDVMLPYYGDVALLQQAVRSVQAQRHEDWRLVVVDDRYPDPEPARWFAQLSDPRIHYLRNETNLGVNGNFRRCLELVQAPAFVMLGSDDVMLPNHLEVVAAAFAAHPGAAVVETGVEVIDEHGAVVRPLGDRVKSWLAPRTDPAAARVVLGGEALAASLLRGNWTYFPSLAFDTEAATAIGFRQCLEVVLDLALLLDLIAAGGQMVLDPAVSFRYRRHSASVSSVRAVDGRRFEEERAFFAGEAAANRDRGWPRAARAARAHLTSRLNALAMVPAALRERDRSAGATLLTHTLR